MVGIGNALIRPLLFAFAATNGGREDYANAPVESPLLLSSSLLTASSVIDEGGSVVIMATTAAATTTDEVSDAIRRLRSMGMERKESHRHSSLRRASVLVPLFVRDNDKGDEHDDNIHVLLTQRPSSMKSHGGEVCLPGGKMDEFVDMGDDLSLIHI